MEQDPDPDPYQNETDSQHCSKPLGVYYLSVRGSCRTAAVRRNYSPAAPVQHEPNNHSTIAEQRCIKFLIQPLGRGLGVCLGSRRLCLPRSGRPTWPHHPVPDRKKGEIFTGGGKYHFEKRGGANIHPWRSDLKFLDLVAGDVLATATVAAVDENVLLAKNLIKQDLDRNKDGIWKNLKTKNSQFLI